MKLFLTLFIATRIAKVAAFAPAGARMNSASLVQNLHTKLAPVFYRNHDKKSTPIRIDNPTIHHIDNPTIHRFERTASQTRHVDQPCILTIDNVRYNVTAWARAHPGGVAVLQKFHEKDTTKAFHAAHHSAAAVKLLQDFAIAGGKSVIRHPAGMLTGETALANGKTHQSIPPESSSSFQHAQKMPHWRAKLFTKEDPIGVHKCLGIFVLLHFAFRFFQMFFTDPSAGFGMRMGQGPSWVPVVCLVPHALLSMSSLIFHTVPKERVVGKPMIWQEYRIHNIGFALRSVISTALCSIAIHGGNTPALRRLAVWGSSLVCLLAIIVADMATHYLRPNEYESTTATMPYWDGCSVVTQKRFKSFYAYSQFLATLACLSVTNPSLPLAVMWPIQEASLLLTLVRKGLLSARGLHIAYTAALIAPYFVGLRTMFFMKSPDVLIMFAVGAALFQLRRRGLNKYALWLPVIVARIALGDNWLKYDIW